MLPLTLSQVGMRFKNKITQRAHAMMGRRAAYIHSCSSCKTITVSATARGEYAACGETPRLRLWKKIISN